MLRRAHRGGLKECVSGNGLPSQTSQWKDSVLTGLVAGVVSRCRSELEFGVKAWRAAGLLGPREGAGTPRSRRPRPGTRLLAPAAFLARTDLEP